MADARANLIIQLKDMASDGLKKVSGGLDTLKKNWLAVTAAVAGAVAFAASSVKAYMEQENAISKLNIALKNQGLFSQTTSSDLQKYSSELQKTSTVGDEVILSQMAMLTSFGLADDQLKNTTKAALDLSKGLGIDLNAATLLLGKAFAGETGALSRYGITIDQTLDKSQKFDAVMAQVNSRFGGAAQAELDTTEGKLANFNNRIGDLKETIGQQLIPTIDFWLRQMERVVGFIERITQKTTEQNTVQDVVIANLKKEIQVTNDLLNSGTVLEESERRRLENKVKLLEASITKEEAKRDEQELIQNQREERKSKFQLEQMAQVEREKEAKRIKEEEQALEKHEKDLERLEEETIGIIEKYQSREELLKQLQEQYGMEKGEILNTYLSAAEQRELLNHTKRLNENKKFNKAMDLENAAFSAAEIKRKEVEEKEKQRIEEIRKQNFSSTLNFISSLSSAKNKELRAIGKAAAISQATIDTFSGIGKAWSLGPILGPPMAALVATAGFANVAKIAGVGLAEGGIVQPRPGGTRAVIGEAGKSEAVIPLDDKKAQEKLAGVMGGNIEININAGVLIGDDAGFQMLVEKIDQELFRFQKTRQSVAF